MKIVPTPTPTSCFKKHRDKMTAEETNIRSQVVLTFFTETFKNTDKSYRDIEKECGQKTTRDYITSPKDIRLIL